MAKPPKPKILGDINAFGSDRPRDNFSPIPARINLGSRSLLRLPLAKILKLSILVAAALFFVVGWATAPTSFLRAAGSENDGERKALEAQLTQLEGQINQYEGQVAGYEKQGKTLKGEISILNGKIARLNLQIQAINLTLRELNKKIDDTHAQIGIAEDNLSRHRAAASRLLENLYESERASLIEIFLKNPQLSDFFGDLTNVGLLQGQLRVVIQQIADLRGELKDKQDQFLLAKADAESLHSYQASQKSEINGAKSEKNKLLDITKGQESKYQALLAQTKETAAEIRSRIFQLLGGGELSFEEAYKYAKLAGGATGIRPALILAVLDRESALGQNVGKCSYKTAMNPASQSLFLGIARELNINPDIVTVSCPNRDGTYGGAMGPAQFVPSTWNLYKGAVSAVTGNKPASPWNNADAFAATALYIKDSMTGCSSIYSSSVSQDRCAAAKYYAGGRWRSYLWTYGEAVVNRARSFQYDIETITG